MAFPETPIVTTLVFLIQLNYLLFSAAPQLVARLLCSPRDAELLSLSQPIATSLRDLTPHKKWHKGNHHLHPTHDPPDSQKEMKFAASARGNSPAICACGYLAIPTDNFWIIIPLPAQLPILATAPAKRTPRDIKFPETSDHNAPAQSLAASFQN